MIQVRSESGLGALEVLNCWPLKATPALPQVIPAAFWDQLLAINQHCVNQLMTGYK